jgi:DNA-binding FadR family transcriptional regulator
MSSSPKNLDPALIAELPSFREAIVKRPITSVISDKIAALIASGILQVGDALPSERHLAAALNVSRDAVRGGIQMLAARGILEISHGARTRVRSNEVGPVGVGFAAVRAVNSYDIESVHAARMLIDPQVVADAARNIDAAGIARLEVLLETQTEALDDPVQFLISDREFHVALYQASGNPLLADISTDLYAYMMEYRREALTDPGAIATSYADHVAIVDAVRARDPEAAAAAFIMHTGRIYATTQPFMKGGG